MIDVRYRQIWFDTVLACGQLSANVRLVAQAIGHSVHVGTGECFPSYETLAAKTALSSRTCMRAVQTLEAAGWISVAHSKGRHANLFKLTTPAALALPAEETRQLAALPHEPEAQETVACSDAKIADRANRDNTLSTLEPCHGLVTVATTQPCQIDVLTVTEPRHPNKENKYTPLKPPTQTGTDIDAAFEELWEIWGNDADKGRARTAFHRATSPSGLNVPSETIIETARSRRLRRFASNASETEPLAQWLRKEGWSVATKRPMSEKRREIEPARHQVFVEEGTPAWRAWKAYRQRQGNGTPSTTFALEGGRRGWHFPSEFPPSVEAMRHG